MKTTQHTRTLNDILSYLKENNHNGLIQKSMMEIARATGYSNATVHRSIRTLDKEGLIKIIPVKSAKKPNKIIYIGPTDDEIKTLLERADIAVRQLMQASNEVQEVMGLIQEAVSFLDESPREYIELH